MAEKFRIFKEKLERTTKKKAGASLGMESTSADSSLGPSAYSINSPGEDAQEKKEEDLDGGPQDSLWSAPEPTQEEPLVVVEENEGWRATYLTAEFFNVIVMSVAFFLLFAAYNTIQNYVTSLLPGLVLSSLSLSHAPPSPPHTREKAFQPRGTRLLLWQATWGECRWACCTSPWP